MTKKKKMSHSDNGDGVYWLGFFGALVYYLQAADSFWLFVLALPKAILWPATIAYKFLESFYGAA